MHTWINPHGSNCPQVEMEDTSYLNTVSLWGIKQGRKTQDIGPAQQPSG